MAVSEKHSYSIDCWCTRCGQAASDIFSGRLQCVQSDNIVPITHIVRGQPLRSIAARLLNG